MISKRSRAGLNSWIAPFFLNPRILEKSNLSNGSVIMIFISGDKVQVIYWISPMDFLRGFGLFFPDLV